MRKSLFFNSIILLIVLFTSCEDDDNNVVNFQPSSTVKVDVDKVTIFDSSFPVNFTSTNDDVDELSILVGTIDKGSVAIVDHKGSATFADEDFGENWAIGKTVSFTSLIDFSTSQSTTVFDINVVDALSSEASAVSVSEYDSTKLYFSSEAKTMFQNMQNVKVEIGVKNADQPEPVFATLKDVDDVMELSYNDSVMGVDYTLGDTVVYKITALGSGHTEMKMLEIPVISKTLSVTSEVTLSTLAPQFAFMPVVEGDDIGEISLVSKTGFSSMDVKFVQIEEGDQVDKMEELDQFSTLVNVLDEATLVSEVAAVKKGDVFAFKYTYMYWDYYGYMVVDDVYSTEIGDDEDGFIFSYKQDMKQ